MGLAASQARLLNLTQRMHQLEHKATRLEAMKLQMANESTRVYEDYLEALEKTKIQVKTLTTDGAVTYVDLQSYDNFLNAGYALVYDNEVYDGTDNKTFEELLNKIGNIINGEGSTGSGSSTNAVQVSNFETALTNVINSGYVTIVTKYGSTFPQPNQIIFHDHETSVATNTGLQEVEDTSALRKAEAKYEADMLRINKKDRKYDSDLAALETERNATKQEMETLKTVAKDNVDRTFKLFG